MKLRNSQRTIRSPIPTTSTRMSMPTFDPNVERVPSPMPTPVLMPALSPTMEKGNLAKWHKKEGDTVKSGDVIAEIETDKATMEVEAADEGTLGKILVPEGTEDVAVNTPIAMILSDGESAADLGKTAAPPSQQKSGESAPPAASAKPSEAKSAPAASAAPPP